MGQQRRGQAVQKSKRRDGGGHKSVSHQTLLGLRIDKQGKERHVKQNRLGVHQRDHHRLAEILARPNMDRRSGARFGAQHVHTQPGQVGGAHPLHGMKSSGVMRQERGQTGHRTPHQHLVASDHAKRRSQAAGNTALARGHHQRQITRPGNEQKQ